MENAETVAQFSSCIRGYHVYQSVWSPIIGEVLGCHRECTNALDRYAICVKKDNEIVGHLPKEISTVCSLFIRRGGSFDEVVQSSVM